MAEEKKSQTQQWLIDNIAEASKRASKTYFLFLSFLAYCALTVVSTTDRQIILNEPVKLPIINVEIDLVGFFIVAPLLIIFIFIYFQLYLKRLTGLINDLRTNFASTRKRRLYPWLFNIAEDPEPGITGKLQVLIIYVTMWLILPIVLFFFFNWGLKKHEIYFSRLQGAILLLEIIIVTLFGVNSGLKRMKRANIIILILISIVLSIYVSLSLMVKNRLSSGNFHIVDLSYQKLVDIPIEEEDFPGVYWLDLKGARLEGANLQSSVLKRADLRDVKFRKAILIDANLRKANLTDANLLEADLTEADLTEANFRGADLTEADLTEANLTEANLTEANLLGANLTGANLTGANLTGANLTKANLTEANIKNAELIGVDLTEANLNGADFIGADLTEANLRAADLRDIKNLTIEQLSKVNTLYEVRNLNPELMKLIEEKYPHLLEEPKEEPIKADKK